ncbi:efflux RND transporter periplasmic adaptor subunit [Salinibacter ruber]|uniref:RND family efflux transporter MFP subunit n=1 Tax=Salinibacter ruber TaxID=146919 RepID=A0A9X2U8R6_9BACT|nr:efflux RND transporter periplasmic adaptor subunit [Salinibacter ruber]MCS3657494.1 RND family efflux transporter MFP subunit [Salinibacter ruber]MCS3951808.1 RND family efflux transporter MFP subunit [Salinibacter ruber]MCS4118180.1 RND family efflux transporter MFP subunit [Salinibacter ruber]MCS4154456.1 RND family efflux transporter MFP subunit [Salinibacter ruber]MCS4171028.1 RND family efflux transporter MFP subunit [Salinibacter ruber]
MLPARFLSPIFRFSTSSILLFSIQLAAAALLTTIFLGCGNEAHRPGAVETSPTPVGTAPATARTTPLPIPASGRLASQAEVQLAFKVGGIIQDLRAQEGDRVRAGQLLARLDLSEINARVQEARSALEKAQRDLKRTRRLYRDSVATLEEMQNAETAVETAEARLQRARFNREHAVIEAPESGRIFRRHAEAGEQVGPGTPVLTLGATGRGWVLETGLPESDVVRVSLGDSATVTFDAHPNTPLDAEVTAIADAANPRTGTYEVELSLSNTDVPLKSGFIGRVTLHPSGTKDYVAVPARALVSGEGRQGTVFTVDPDSQTVRRRSVEVARVLGSTIVVSEGLSASTPVVVEGKRAVSEGNKVQVLED